MTNRNPLIRPAMTAIAAVLACSTPSFAQSADPPVAETTPAPVVDVAPVPVAPAPVPSAPIVPDTPIAADPLEPAEAVATPVAPRATTARTPIVRSRPAPARTAPARTANAAPAAAPAPAAPIAAPVAEAPAVEPLPAPPEAAPVAAPAETADASSNDAMLPVAAGGLAILALAGTGLFLRRRKRLAAEAEEAEMREAALAAADDPEPAMIVEPEPAFVPEPVRTEPTFVAVSAPEAVTSEPSPEIDGLGTEPPEDVAPGSRVEAAYAGPTADNPSLSIKKRLKRAAFFDQREFLVEAGEVAPMADDAGLPDAVEVPARD